MIRNIPSCEICHSSVFNIKSLNHFIMICCSVWSSLFDIFRQRVNISAVHPILLPLPTVLCKCQDIALIVYTSHTVFISVFGCKDFLGHCPGQVAVFCVFWAVVPQQGHHHLTWNWNIKISYLWFYERLQRDTKETIAPDFNLSQVHLPHLENHFMIVITTWFLKLHITIYFICPSRNPPFTPNWATNCKLRLWWITIIINRSILHVYYGYYGLPWVYDVTVNNQRSMQNGRVILKVKFVNRQTNCIS